MTPLLGVFDMDGTAYRNSLNIDLVERLRARGFLHHADFSEVDTAKKRWKDRESPDAFEAYNRALVVMLEADMFKVSMHVVAAVCDELVTEQGRQLYEFTRELILTLQELGGTLIAISGSPKPVVEAFVKPLGFTHVRATEYEVADGHYTGRITALPVNDKAGTLREILREYSVSPEHVVAVGDTLSDYGMLAASRYGIAFNPSRALKARIREDGVGIWSRPLGVVTQRKDDISISTFKNDHLFRPRLVEAGLSSILPPQVAKRLAERLGHLYQYDE